MSAPLLQADIDRFIAKGVPPLALVKNPIGDYAFILRDRVSVAQDRFEFDRDGKPTFTLAMFDRAGDVADVLAFRPGESPALWKGLVGVVGEEQIDWVDGLKVHQTVMGWLRSGRDGIVILNPQWAADALRGVTLKVATEAHRHRLEKMLTVRAPRVVVVDRTKPNV